MTKLSVDAARSLAPGEVLYDHDPRSKGLCLRARGTKKSWHLIYRNGDGRQKFPKLGEFPALPIEAAREVARAWKQKIAKGEDPGGERQAARVAPTMNDLCDHYIDVYVPANYAAETKSKAESIVRLYIRPELGHLRVAAVMTSQCNRLFARIADGAFTVPGYNGKPRKNTPSPHTAKLARAYLSKMFSIAESESMQWRPRGTNPCRDEDVLTFQTSARRVHVHADEFWRVNEALGKLAVENQWPVACIYVALLCGTRLTEIAKARRSQIAVDDMGQHELVLQKHKTAKKTGETRILITAPAVRIINELPVHVSGYIFGPLGELEAPRRAIWEVWDKARRLAGIRPEVQARDLRRTFASVARTQGAQLEDIQPILRHKSVRTTEGYAYLFQEATQSLADRTAGKIQKMLDGPTPEPRQELPRDVDQE